MVSSVQATGTSKADTSDSAQAISLGSNSKFGEKEQKKLGKKSIIFGGETKFWKNSRSFGKVQYFGKNIGCFLSKWQNMAPGWVGYMYA